MAVKISKPSLKKLIQKVRLRPSLPLSKIKKEWQVDESKLRMVYR